MPLPKQQSNWAARIVVMLITAVAIGLVFPLAWLLHRTVAPDFVLYPVMTIWVVLVPMCTLWSISVWAPVRGRKLVALVLKSPWFFG